jgi:hypothetical protein
MAKRFAAEIMLSAARRKEIASLGARARRSR